MMNLTLAGPDGIDSGHAYVIRRLQAGEPSDSLYATALNLLEIAVKERQRAAAKDWTVAVHRWSLTEAQLMMLIASLANWDQDDPATAQRYLDSAHWIALRNGHHHLLGDIVNRRGQIYIDTGHPNRVLSLIDAVQAKLEPWDQLQLYLRTAEAHALIGTHEALAMKAIDRARALYTRLQSWGLPQPQYASYVDLPRIDTVAGAVALKFGHHKLAVELCTQAASAAGKSNQAHLAVVHGLAARGYALLKEDEAASAALQDCIIRAAATRSKGRQRVARESMRVLISACSGSAALAQLTELVQDHREYRFARVPSAQTFDLPH